MNGAPKFVIYNGKRMRLADAVRSAGSIITLENARRRIFKLGWSVERAVTTGRIENYGQLDPVLRKERELARWRKNSAARKAKRRAAKATTLAAKGISKTAPAYRKLLRPVQEMSKNELRAMLAEAVRNTARAA